MADYRGLVANCVIGGELFTEEDGDRFRNLIQFRLDRFNIEILQVPAIVTSLPGDFKGKTIASTSLIIRDLPPEDFDQAELIARDISELLSLATSSEVALYGYEFPDIDPVKVIRSILGKVQYFRPLFAVERGDIIRSFLEQSWPTFRQLREVRQLNIAFDYYALSEREEPIELKLITCFVLLENLKHTYAQQRGYPFIKGYFRQLGATRRALGPSKTFEDLLTEMFATVGMNPDLTAIIRLRNNLIHSGIANMNINEKLEMYQRVHDILREYFLRLLAYKGECFLYSGQLVIV